MEKNHWERVYETKGPAEVSWFQAHPRRSLGFIRQARLAKDGPVIDVGGGASTLVDELLGEGLTDLTVLDLSGAALAVAQERLGDRAADVTWLEADVTQVSLPRHHYAVWHDRATFHFLTRPEDRERYLEAVRHAVRPGGYVVVATFAPNGPSRCSGLEVVRYSPGEVHRTFGDAFVPVSSTEETHVTPSGLEQAFTYCLCRKLPVPEGVTRRSGFSHTKSVAQPSDAASSK